MARCRAVVFAGDGSYTVQEFAVPVPPPGGAVLRVEAVGLCGSDIAQLDGVELVPGGSAFPVVPGHETVGRVVALAPDADLGVAEGDRVAIDERLSLAPLRIYGYSDMAGAGRPGLWGGYGEYMELFPGTLLFTLPDDRPAHELTLFEPLANAVHWASITDVQAGETVVVQGPGHQGLAVLQAVLPRDPALVVVTGIAADAVRLACATAIGAHAVVAVDERDPEQVVLELTGQGADVVFDITDAPQAVSLAMRLVRPGGRVLLAGLKHFEPVRDLVSDLIVLKALRVLGGAGYTTDSMAEAIRLITSGAVRTDLVAGESFAIDQIDEAISLLRRDDPTRDAVRVSLRHE